MKKQRKTFWTRAKLALLRREYPRTSTESCAFILGATLDATKKKASRLRLRKSRAYMKSLGR